MAGAPDSAATRLSAVAAWMGDEGFFHGTTAARLLELDGVIPPDVIAVARYAGFASPPWIRIHRLRPVDTPPIRRVSGFRIPSIERILIDSAATLPVRRIHLPLDDALRRHLTTVDRMKTYLAGPGRGRRGAKALRLLIQERDETDEKVRSGFESKMLSILRRIKEHRFLANFEIFVNGARYFLDFYCPAARFGIECHSFRWHVGRHNADAKRDRDIRSLGIEVIYFTWDDVRLRAREVEEEIRAALGRRLALPFQEIHLDGRKRGRTG